MHRSACEAAGHFKAHAGRVVGDRGVGRSTMPLDVVIVTKRTGHGLLVTVICLRAEWSKVTGEQLHQGLDDVEDVRFNERD
jgi:hypothetical protein